MTAPRHMRRFTALATVGLWVALAAVATPVAAGPPPPSGYDGAYARFGASNGAGLVLLEVLDADSARLTTAMSDLPAGVRFRLVFSTATCGQPLSGGNQVVAKWFRSDARHGSYRSEVVPWLWGFQNQPVAVSARLMEEEGIYYYFCATVHTYQRFATASSSIVTADVEFTRFHDDSVRGVALLDRLDGTRGRLTVSVAGLKPGGSYRLVAGSGTCASAVTPETKVYSKHLVPDVGGHAIHAEKNQDIEVENDETHWVGHDRIKAVDGAVVACRPATVAHAYP